MRWCHRIASNVLFFDVFCRLGLFLAELHPEHHVAGRIRENPRKCLRESVMSRWIPVRARRAIRPLTTAIITWPVKRAEVRHRTHRRWVWNGVNMAYFFLKPFLVCPNVLTAIRQESHHFLDKWAHLNLFGIVWHFGHCHYLLFRTFSISERLKRYNILFDCFRTCKFGKSDPQWKFIVFRPLRLLIMLGFENLRLREKKKWKKTKGTGNILRVKWQKKRGVKTVSTCQHWRARLWDVIAVDVWMLGCPRSVWLFKINEFATGCQQDARLLISTHKWTDFFFLPVNVHSIQSYKCMYICIICMYLRTFAMDFTNSQNWTWMYVREFRRYLHAHIMKTY